MPAACCASPAGDLISGTFVHGRTIGQQRRKKFDVRQFFQVLSSFQTRESFWPISLAGCCARSRWCGGPNCRWCEARVAATRCPYSRRVTGCCWKCRASCCVLSGHDTGPFRDCEDGRFEPSVMIPPSGCRHRSGDSPDRVRPAIQQNARLNARSNARLNARLNARPNIHSPSPRPTS